MKTLRKITIEPIYVENAPKWEQMEQDKLYISEEYSCILHKCLCGCGDKVVLPIHNQNGWELIKHDDGRISITPSIGNFQFECKSHYIITKNVANFV